MKDLYKVLGVEKFANSDDIKKAYREIAKQYHPDITRCENSERFREVREAYEVLSNEQKRYEYDTMLRAESVSRKRRKEDFESRYSDPVRESGRSPFAEMFSGSEADIFGINNVFRQTEDIFSRSSRGREKESVVQEFMDSLNAKLNERSETEFDLILTPLEAKRGGRLNTTVPVYRSCPACRSMPKWGSNFCHLCGGSGKVKGSKKVHIDIPPGVRHGEELILNVSGSGHRTIPLYLKVIIRE